MTKKQIVHGIVGGLILLIIGGVVGVWLRFPKFEVENKSSVKQFRLSTVWGNVFLWKMGYIKKVGRVTVIYTDEPQSAYRLNGIDGQEVMSTGITKRNGKITLSVRYNKDTIDELSSRSYWFARDIYAGICMAIEENNLSEVDDCYRKSTDYVDWSNAKKIPSIIKGKNLINFSLVKQAYAQTCVGTIPCGQTVSGSHCVGGTEHNKSCSDWRDCPGGTCTGGQYCNTTLNNLQCSAISTYGMCVSPDIMVDECATRCNISSENFCSWSVDGGGGGGGSFCRLGLVGPTTHNCSTGNRSGLNRQVYDAAIQDNNHLTQNDYVCGPRIDDLKIDYAGSGNNSTDADSCGGYLAKFSGYFYASVAGNYQFLVDVFPNGGFSIDGVNGVPVDNNPLPCTSANGLRRVGDRYWAARVRECGNYEPGWALDPIQGGYDGNYTLCRDSTTNDYKGVVPGNLFNRNFGTTNDTGGQTKFWGTWPFPWYVPYPSVPGNGEVSGSDHPTSAPFIPPYYTQDAWRTPESSECIYNSPTTDRSGFIVPTGSIADLAEEDAGDAKVRLWARRYLTAGYHRVEGWHYWSRWLTGSEGGVNSQLDFYVKRPGDASFVRTRDLPLDASCPFTACDGTPVCTAAPPHAPTRVAPADNLTIVPPNVTNTTNPQTVTLQWAHDNNWGINCPNPGTQDFVYCVSANQAVVDAFTGSSSAGCFASGTNSSADRDAVVSNIPNNGTRYYWKVIARHGGQSTASAMWSFYAPRILTIEGHRSMTCDPASPALYPWTLSSTPVPLQAGWPNPALTSPINGVLNILVPSTRLINVTGTPPANHQIPTCGLATQVVPATTANHTLRFYAETAAPRWWQAYGGDVYGATGISAGPLSVPNPSCIACDLISPSRRGGVLMTNSNSISITGATLTTDTNWRTLNIDLTLADIQQGFDQFERSFQLGTLSTSQEMATTNTTSIINSDADVASLRSLNDLAVYAPTDDSNVYYHQGDVEISGNITGRHVFFIRGNLTVTGDLTTDLTAASNDFLGFIVTGDITFNNTVKRADGLFIAENNITVVDMPHNDSNLTGADRIFTGNGIFIGYSNVALNRTLNSTLVATDDLVNNTTAAHQFNYNSNLLLNAPDGFKTSSIQWQEVDPVKELPAP